ncbi:hypothetical protein APHAL10511_008090 [Amanita phalloides]|nr:hypothetical protein APHAL10511_008090 [Amanita phalloides]
MLGLPVKIFKQRHHHGWQLYIAYYYRTPTPGNPVRYHTALIALPKPVVENKSDSEATTGSESEGYNPSAPSSADRSLAFKFHAVNVPVNDHGQGRVIWEYRVEKEEPHMAGTLRMRLACLLLVGTIPSESKLERALKKVEANKYADEHPDYVCTTWLYDALSLLVEEKMVDPLPCPPADFWEIGARYADNWKEGHNSQMVAIEMAIPCCDKDGKTLPTPMGPLQE